MKTCLECSAFLNKRHQIKFCSNRCQLNYRYHEYIKEWKLKNKTGIRGFITKNISKHLKRYLIEKYGEKCFLCGWNKRHAVTGRVPIEVDHKDGDAKNNKEHNLRLLCPNCHSLTVNFRNLNEGKGRFWRKKVSFKSF